MTNPIFAKDRQKIGNPNFKNCSTLWVVYICRYIHTYTHCVICQEQCLSLTLLSLSFCCCCCCISFVSYISWCYRPRSLLWHRLNSLLSASLWVDVSTCLSTWLYSTIGWECEEVKNNNNNNNLWTFPLRENSSSGEKGSLHFSFFCLPWLKVIQKSNFWKVFCGKVWRMHLDVNALWMYFNHGKMVLKL